MVQPLTQQEQARSKPFSNYEGLAIIFAASRFNAVLKRTPQNEFVQMYGDIAQANRDAEDFKQLLN